MATKAATPTSAPASVVLASSETKRRVNMDVDVAGGMGSASESTHILHATYPLDPQLLSRCFSPMKKKKKPE